MICLSITACGLSFNQFLWSVFQSILVVCLSIDSCGLSFNQFLRLRFVPYFSSELAVLDPGVFKLSLLLWSVQFMFICISCFSCSLSRYKLKFSPDKVDTMIVQAVGLLDDLDKELNNYIMRTREWYGWHFPEMGKLITDNIAFVKTIKTMGAFCFCDCLEY